MVNSIVTAVQLGIIEWNHGWINANEDAYQDYIDANSDSFSSPATLAEVQAMITAVNTAQTSILAQIGNEGKVDKHTRRYSKFCCNSSSSSIIKWNHRCSKCK